jgi:site-specific DNA-methyltransferase (adenine-specific)
MIDKKLINRVHQSECVDFLRSLPENSIDHFITDPPYNISGYSDIRKIGWLKSNPLWSEEKNYSKIDESWDKFEDESYVNFTQTWLSEVVRVVKPNGNILVFGSYHNIYTVGWVVSMMNLKVNNSIIWYKRNAFPNITGRMLCESTEQIIWAVNETPKKAKNWVFNYEDLKLLTDNGKQMRNMWDIPMTPTSERKFGKHPSQKPLQLSERLIIGFTKQKEIILDPFSGSGSFLVAAKSLDRNFIGIDQDPSFVDLANRRLRESSR